MDVTSGDLIICSELSRLGRSLFMIMSILNLLMERGTRVWTIKDHYRLGDDIQSKVLAFAFGLSAEIERNLISQRTKEALERKKAEGVILGRPKGSCSKRHYLDGLEQHIMLLRGCGLSMNAVAKHLKVSRTTLRKYTAERISGRRID
jgi:Site-specific recombinases, DNA invertase Pin homologs